MIVPTVDIVEVLEIDNSRLPSASSSISTHSCSLSSVITFCLSEIERYFYCCKKLHRLMMFFLNFDFSISVAKFSFVSFLFSSWVYFHNVHILQLHHSLLLWMWNLSHSIHKIVIFIIHLDGLSYIGPRKSSDYIFFVITIGFPSK